MVHINDLVDGLKKGILGLGLILAASCGGGSGDGNTPGCIKDTDCKGNRVCVEGTCVEGEKPKEDLYAPDKDIISDNYQPNCTSHAKKVCSGDDLYWHDSCGNLENKIENCDSGCSNGKCNEPGDIVEDIVYDQGSSCNDECNDYGQTKCSGNGWKECGDYDSDPCLEWSSLNNCESYEKCEEGGGCVLKPGSYCSHCVGDLDCLEGMKCYAFSDKDGNELSTFCTDDLTCSSNSDCINIYDCNDYSLHCTPITILVCNDDNNVWVKDTCENWLTVAEECSSNEVCESGKCK